MSQSAVGSELEELGGSSVCAGPSVRLDVLCQSWNCWMPRSSPTLYQPARDEADEGASRRPVARARVQCLWTVR